MRPLHCKRGVIQTVRRAISRCGVDAEHACRYLDQLFVDAKQRQTGAGAVTSSSGASNKPTDRCRTGGGFLIVVGPRGPVSYASGPLLVAPRQVPSLCRLFCAFALGRLVVSGGSMELVP